MALHHFFKPAEVNCQFNPAPVRDPDETVKLRLNTKPSLKCRGEYAKFTPEQQANIACYACKHGNKAAIPGYLALFDRLIPHRQKLPLLVNTHGNLYTIDSIENIL